MASQTVPYITPEEYLKAEREAEFKSEYYEGQVFAMPRGSLRHNRIATYPDASVVCGDVEVHQTDNLVNPTVIVEVSLQSTERHDRTTKFFDYQSIPSLREYLMVSQKSRSITRCTRIRGAEWRIETGGAEKGVIRLDSIGVDLSFDQIYAGADSLPG